MRTIRMESTLWAMLAVLGTACWSSACNGTAAVESRPSSQETAQAADAARAAEAVQAEKEARRAQLRTDISAVESERNALTSRLETTTKSAGMAQLQSESCQHAIQEQEIATRAFMMEHNAVVIAIVAGFSGGLALNDPKLSDEMKGLGGFAAALALIYAASHLDEVAQVGDALMQADSHIKDLRAASERADQERQNAEGQMKDLQANIAGLDQKLGELRASLAAL
jgi:septal ring factor EnvC (AmiA/AmiB activator)